jgi:hypothetical protein
MHSENKVKINDELVTLQNAFSRLKERHGMTQPEYEQEFLTNVYHYEASRRQLMVNNFLLKPSLLLLFYCFLLNYPKNWFMK